MKYLAIPLTFFFGLSSLMLSCGAKQQGSAPAGTTNSQANPSSPGASSGEPVKAEPYIVTEVRGPSWLKYLGVSEPETHFGQMGGSESAPVSQRREPALAPKAGSDWQSFTSMMDRCIPLFRSNPQEAAKVFNESFVLGGADLYRLDCQSCHGLRGDGAPPEINSLLGPVQGTSTALIMKRMEDKGTPVDEDFAKELAAQAEDNLRERIQKGGKNMPPFDHLRGDEVEALVGYLEKLAGVPPTARAKLLVPESGARVAEHLVKGTCHICHDATGPGGGHMAMMQGIIPSLASIPADQSLSGVIRQVQYGSSGMMMMMGGNRMPAFPYLTEEEVAASYFYLVQYPPKP
jgi:mono/diheme cytochrome c family protein